MDKPFGLFRYVLNYIKHQISAGNQHSLHPPFAYDFYIRVVKASRKQGAHFSAIENYRRRLKKDSTILNFIDPSSGNNRRVMLKNIVASSAKNARLGRLLSYAVNYFKPDVMLELGTSLGISTAYQIALHTPQKFITIEANELLQQRAKYYFTRQALDCVESKCGYFNDIIPQLDNLNTITWVFIDGNHLYKPTCGYADFFLESLPDNAVLVFDDINWSPGMQKAWQYITNHPKAILNLDFYFIGFVIVNKNLSKQTFKLRL